MQLTKLALTLNGLLGGRGSGLAVPVPEIGTDLVANGGFDSDTEWTKGTGWTITGGVGVKSSGATSDITQNIMTAGAWYHAQYTLVRNAGTFRLLNGSSPGDSYYNNANSGTILYSMRGLGALFGVRGANSSSDGTVDDISLKQIALPSLFSVRDTGLTHATTTASVTLAISPVLSARAGVVANLDSADTPGNFVLATHDGLNARLTKCVGGTYTDLISVGATYSAGATIEIRRLASSDTYQLWYNGNQVGTDQTISDASITSNTLYGYFNTHEDNELSSFVCSEAQ